MKPNFSNLFVFAHTASIPLASNTTAVIRIRGEKRARPQKQYINWMCDDTKRVLLIYQWDIPWASFLASWGGGGRHWTDISFSKHHSSISVIPMTIMVLSHWLVMPMLVLLLPLQPAQPPRHRHPTELNGWGWCCKLLSSCLVRAHLQALSSWLMPSGFLCFNNKSLCVIISAHSFAWAVSLRSSRLRRRGSVWADGWRAKATAKYHIKNTLFL